MPALIITVFVEGRNPNKGTTTWLLVMTLLQYCEQETHALLCLLLITNMQLHTVQRAAL